MDWSKTMRRFTFAQFQHACKYRKDHGGDDHVWVCSKPKDLDMGTTCAPENCPYWKDSRPAPKRVCTECGKQIVLHEKWTVVNGKGYQHRNCKKPESYR